MNGILQKFSEADGKYSMLKGRHGILLGYSGGSDSTCLLHILKQICAERGIFLKAVHIHHGIRAGEADRDARFCQSQCEDLGVEFELIRADIPKLCENSGKSIEECARDFRYAQFERLLDSDERLDTLATAHNANDSAETVLFNLCRGTGLHGLGGIAPVRKIGEYTVIRPLIFCLKSEIEEYCNENSYKFIFDSTNSDTEYTRNFIRYELVPKFEKINPSFVNTAMKLAEGAREDDSFIEKCAEDFYGMHCEKKSCPVEKLRELPQAVFARVIKKMTCGITLERVHIEAIAQLTEKGENNTSLSLPASLCARIEKGNLIFSETETKSTEYYEYPLSYGENIIEEENFAVIIAPDYEDFRKKTEKYENIYKLSIYNRLKSDRIEGTLSVRSRKNGDSYRFGNMERKLKKLFNSKKLTPLQKESLPLICDEAGILLAYGFPVADRAKSDGQTECIHIAVFTDKDYL